MPDYGRDLTFGYFLVPNAADPLLDTAREVEARGLDWIGVQDHPYQRRYVDTWALLSMIAAVTSRVRVFPDVANLPLRPPAVMAKAAASLDVLSGGRFELALGAGGFWDAIEAYGGPRRAPARRARRARGGDPGHPPGLERRAQPALRRRRTTGWPARTPGRCRPIRSASGSACTARGRCGSPAGSPTAGCRRCAARSARWREMAGPPRRGGGRRPAATRRRSAGCSTSTARSPTAPATGCCDGPVDQWVDELTDLAVGLRLRHVRLLGRRRRPAAPLRRGGRAGRTRPGRRGARPVLDSGGA